MPKKGSDPLVHFKAQDGDRTFDMDGPESVVWKFYREWKKDGEVPSHRQREAAQLTPPPAANARGNTSQLTNEEAERAFLKDDGGIVSLCGVPDTEKAQRDLLLALLLGQLVMAGRDRVFGAVLKRGAVQTGLNIKRIDYYLNTCSYVNTDGIGRSKSYGLNKEGVRRATEIVRLVLKGKRG